MQDLSKVFLDRLKVVECPDSTYAFTNPALVFAKARGSKIYDVAGRAYTDLCAGFATLALGHNHPSVVQVMQRHAADLPPIVHGLGDVYASQDKIELLELLLSTLNSEIGSSHFAQAALALSGGQAVEIALKTAMLATSAAGFITFKGGYHGVDLGVLPVTARQDFSRPFAKWIAAASVEKLPYGASADAVAQAVDCLRGKGAGFAGIVVEPIQGRAGIVSPPVGWLAMLREMASLHQGLLIFDEIYCGLGRTGRMTFASEVKSDLSCFGKALGGGFPLSACVGTKKVMSSWPESAGEAIHTGTFFGHPFSCAVGKATLKTMAHEKLPTRARDVGARLQTHLRQLFSKQDVEVRGEGLMTAIDFKRAEQGVIVMNRLRERGVVALCSGAKGEVLSLTPALNIPEDELSAAIKQLA